MSLYITFCSYLSISLSISTHTHTHTHTHILYIYIYIYIERERERKENRPRVCSAMPWSSLTKDSKILLDASLLNIRLEKVRIKGKWSNFGKGVSPPPTAGCCSYWKVSVQVTLDHGRPIYIYIYIYIYIHTHLYIYIYIYIYECHKWIRVMFLKKHIWGFFYRPFFSHKLRLCIIWNWFKEKKLF